LVSNRFFESRLKEFSRDLALAEARQVGSWGDFGISFSKVSFDFGSWDGHDDMALASGRFIDFELKI
jgi:hypothetical protein